MLCCARQSICSVLSFPRGSYSAAVRLLPLSRSSAEGTTKEGGDLNSYARCFNGGLMARKTLTSLQKLKVVLDGLQENMVVTTLCVEQGISRSTFYRWRKLVLVGLEVLFAKNKNLLQDSKVSRAHKRRYRCR